MSDHIGLRYLFDHPNLNARQARWLAMINEFDFEIRYRCTGSGLFPYNRWIGQVPRHDICGI